MPRMKRKDALRALIYAGYHDDTSSFVRLYIENRISIQIAREYFRKGALARERGIPATAKEAGAS